MGVEDHQPAHQHDEDDERVEPVPQPGRQAVAPDPARQYIEWSQTHIQNVLQPVFYQVDKGDLPGLPGDPVQHVGVQVVQKVFDPAHPGLPSTWTPEQKAAIEKFGYDKLMDRLKELLKEQKERHEGGNKWIGTGGTSPFGNGGENPEGIRIGGEGGNRTAVKVWEARSYRDYDDERELGTRNIKVALRRLRRFARDGAAEEFALDDTIRATAHNAGYLEIKMQPERKNNIKVLMLLDVGGTMDDHIARTEELFSAAKTEFKNMEFFYFHNCIYDYLWKNNRRRHAEKFPTWDILRKYPPDTKVIFVGDATMSPYEILQPGGSVEYNNDEAGAEWLQRFTATFPKFIWLNPEPESYWAQGDSVMHRYARFCHVAKQCGTIEQLERIIEDVLRSYQLGVNAYVVKPVEFKQFVEAIADLGIFWAVLNEPPPGSLRTTRRRHD